MTDRAAFLEAIVEQPTDDLPRLVFADWLDDHDEPERAEFIRLQCAFARGEPAARSQSARARMQTLEEEHRAAWIGPLSRIVFRAGFHRGFVEHAVVSAASLLRHAPTLREQVPLRGVTLLGARRVLPEVVRSTILKGLTALHLTGGRIGDDGLQLLATCSALSDLETLRLGDNVIGDSGVIALTRSPHLSRLTSLVLRDNAIGDSGAWELAHAPHLGRLLELDLAGNEIGPSGEAALHSAPKLPLLTALDLADQRPAYGRRPRQALAAIK